jgi:hypothetical protein
VAPGSVVWPHPSTPVVGGGGFGEADTVGSRSGPSGALCRGVGRADFDLVGWATGRLGLFKSGITGLLVSCDRSVPPPVPVPGEVQAC